MYVVLVTFSVPPVLALARPPVIHLPAAHLFPYKTCDDLSGGLKNNLPAPIALQLDGHRRIFNPVCLKQERADGCRQFLNGSKHEKEKRTWVRSMF
jgi:hypothetical protein